MRSVLVVAAALALTSCQWIPGTPQASVEKAKSVVREELVDGKSAQFENVVVANVTGRGEMVCGWVNGRNSFGAYAGPQPFLVADGRTQILGSNIATGWEGALGTCVALDRAASARLMRDADRALDAYEAALKRTG